MYRARVTYENGEIYEGMFNKLGEKHGYGEYTFKSHGIIIKSLIFLN